MKDAVLGADCLDVEIHWSDQTPYGSTLSGRAQDLIRSTLHPTATKTIVLQVQQRKRKALLSNVIADIVRVERKAESYRKIVEDPLFWYPPSNKIRPERVSVLATDLGESVEGRLDISAIKDLRSLLAGEGGNYHIKRLVERSAVRAKSGGLRRMHLTHDDCKRALFCGHACVSWSDGDLRLWTDPFLRPKSIRHSPWYQPILPSDCPEIHHAVLLTHTHPDHLHPGTLLRFPAATSFYVPEVLQESLLSLDAVYRLKQLGFQDVHTIRWWQSVEVGDFVVTALPFYGEQPLGKDSSPGVRDFNYGNTYAIAQRRGPTSIVLADSGADSRGNTLTLARELRKHFKSIQTIYANQLSWRIYPPQYLTTSIPQYLLYIPDEDLPVAQQIMMEQRELETFADIVKAKFIVPYAMGGARWYKEIGLGFDHFQKSAWRPPFSRAKFRMKQDPFDALIQTSAQQISLAPGQTLAMDGQVRFAGGQHVRKLKRAAPPLGDEAKLFWQIDMSMNSRLLLTEIDALSSVDSGGIVVADSRMCEIYSSRGANGDLFRALLQRLLATVEGPIIRRAKPVTAEPFYEEKGLYRHFRQCLVEVQHARQRKADVLLVVRKLRNSALLSDVPNEAFAHVLASISGIRIPLFKKNELERYDFTSQPRPRLKLPARAKPLARRFGHESIELALLWVKVAHLAYSTSLMLGPTMVPTTENVWFDKLLTTPSARSRSGKRLGTLA